jgi:hypothetical protein
MRQFMRKSGLNDLIKVDKGAAMVSKKKGDDWMLVPFSPQDIDIVRKKCRRLVTRRAAICAGVSAIPIPGIEVVPALSLFALLIEDINREFGLTPEQARLLRPELMLLAYESMVAVGDVMLGKLAARVVLTGVLQRSGIRLLSRHATKLAPIAGQIASSALSFAIFRLIGNQHVDACVLAAQATLAAYRDTEG